MFAALITAVLVVTPAPGGQADNFAAFFTEDGPAVCDAIAEVLNRDNPEMLFVCQKEGVGNATTNPPSGRTDTNQVSYRF